MIQNDYDTIVVGGGIAGLTSAAYLARAGKKVLLIEKNTQCGGLVSSFTRDGFHFDAGIRALEDAGIILPMLKDLGIKIDFVKSPVSVGVEKEIINIKNINSLRDYEQLLVNLYPESTEDIKKFIVLIRKIIKDMDVIYGIENPVLKDLKHDRKYIFKTLLPWLPKFLFTIGRINRMNMPVESYLADMIKSRPLRDIISQHFFHHTPTFFALSYFSLYLDYFYPVGGIGKLSETLEEKIIACKGEIKKETKIIQVLADDKKVIDENKNIYSYKKLVWASNLKSLYSNVQIKGFSSDTRKKIEIVKNNLKTKRGGDSVFTLFLEVNENPDSFRKIANGHFFYTPSRNGLGDVRTRELERLLKSTTLDKKQVLEWLDKFINLNTFEISIPALRDPKLSPPGKTGLIISLLAEYDLFKKIQQEGWYDKFKIEVENRIIEAIGNSVYPMLKNKIIARFSFSPLSIENRVGSSEGAITGWSFRESVPVFNQIQNTGRSVSTPIPDVYQAGQWSFSPSGVPIAILTGKIATNKILNK